MPFLTSPGITSAAGRTFGPIITYPSLKHTATVIMLHGLGDTGNGWAPVAPQLGLDHVKWIFPTAPTRPVTVNMGMSMPAWFDMDHLDDESFASIAQGNRPGFDPAGVSESLECIRTLVSREISEGIPPHRIIVGGFSQGGNIALKFSLQSHDRLGGCVALSTWLEPVKNMEVSKSNLNIPIFCGHGTCDQYLPVAVPHATKHFLEQIGCSAIDLKIYPGMPHSTCSEELSDLRAFVKRVLPDENAKGVDEKTTEEELRTMSARQLKEFIAARGGSTTGMLEKGELIEKATQLL